MTAPPPDEEPEETSTSDDQGPEPARKLDFDAEFERLVANWTPSPGEAASSEDSEPPIDPGSPKSSSPGPGTDESLRNLFRPAWSEEPEPETREERTEVEEHFVPPPAPPIPRPEPPRLLAWAGVLAAPLVALLLLVLGALPSWAALVLFGWFVGGFCYLVATMRSDGRDGWDDGARI